MTITFDTPVLARSVKFQALDNMGKTFAVQFEIYGCPYWDLIGKRVMFISGYNIIILPEL